MIKNKELTDAALKVIDNMGNLSDLEKIVILKTATGILEASHYGQFMATMAVDMIRRY